MASSHVVHHKTQETTHSDKTKNVLGRHGSKEETNHKTNKFVHSSSHEKQHSLDHHTEHNGKDSKHHEETHKQKKSTTHGPLRKSQSQRQSVEKHDLIDTEQPDRPGSVN